MDKLPVGQLPDLTQSNNDDEIMVITDSEHNQLKKEKISDFITDLTSTDENNALTKGTDGKMFVTDFGNASNITEGTLPTSVLPDIPKDKLPPIETSDLPASGVTADTYAYPSSVTVNAQGQVTAIAEGTPSGANADTDLSNLTPTGEKHFLNKSQVTNCLLEVPQRIKLTFDNDQGLVLHAGSEVIVPYGKGTPTMQIGDALNGGVISDVQVVGDDNKIFYYITYNSDIVVGKTIGTGGDTFWLYVTPEGTIAGDITGEIYSQAAQPAGISEFVIWYDTTNNYVKVTLNTGSSWTQGNSLLIGRVNRTGTGTITGVRDIYNGVGVIGSNFWVDKDVVYCTPAGRNPDGSLKNNIGKTNHLYIGPSDAGGQQRYIFFNPYGDENPNPSFIYDYISYDWGPILPEDLRGGPNVATYGIFYDQSDNLFYVSTSDSPKWTVIPKGIVHLGLISHDNNRGSATDGYPVTSGNFYTANNPFYLLKYADRLMISNWAFPSISGGSINLGLGRSGSEYIAPTDGYVILSKTATAAGQYVQIGAGIISRMYAPSNGSDVVACLPVGRHDIFNVTYTAAGKTKYFRFFVTNSYDR